MATSPACGRLPCGLPTGTGFYYHTGTPKRVYSQLKKNPNIELCFYAPGEMGAGRMTRGTGKVEFLKDTVLEEKLFADRL